MNRPLALIVAAALLVGCNAQAQPTGSPLVLWPSRSSPDMNLAPSEGWTLPSQAWPSGGGGALPQNWPPAAGWSPSEGLPVLQAWGPPQGWPPAEDWSGVSENAIPLPIVIGSLTLLTVLIRQAGQTGFCWYNGPYSEGAVRDGRKCICTPYLGFFRSCGWADADSR